MTTKGDVALFESGNYAAAAEQLSKELHHDRNNPSTWNALGMCFYKTGKYYEADTCFDNAIRLDSANQTYKINKAVNEKKIINEDFKIE